MSDIVYDIHAVLEKYGWDLPAPRSGWVTVKCHEHADSHASARISSDLGAVKCQACGFGGDVISIIKLKEGCTYAEAVRIAEEATSGSGREVRQSGYRGGTVSGREGYHNRGRRYAPSWRSA